MNGYNEYIGAYLVWFMYLEDERDLKSVYLEDWLDLKCKR